MAFLSSEKENSYTWIPW